MNWKLFRKRSDLLKVPSMNLYEGTEDNHENLRTVGIGAEI